MLHSRHFECTVERGVYWAGCLRIEIQLYTMFIQLGIYLMTVFGEHETSIFTRVFRLKPSSPQGFIHSSKRHKKSELTWQVVFLHEERTRIDTYNSCGGLLITGNSKKVIFTWNHLLMNILILASKNLRLKLSHSCKFVWLSQREAL